MPYKALATSMGVVHRCSGWKELVWEGGASGSYWAFDTVPAPQFPHQNKDLTNNVQLVPYKFVVYFLATYLLLWNQPQKVCILQRREARALDSLMTHTTVGRAQRGLLT